MTETFEYSFSMVAENAFTIEDTGNCAILAANDLNHIYVLLIKTEDGITSTLEYGPRLPDIEEPTPRCSWVTTRFDYNEKKISNCIKKFIENPQHVINDVQVIDYREGLALIQSPKMLM